MLVTPLLGGGKEASRLYAEARRAERSGQIVSAYLLYSQAAAADPQNRKYWARSQALRTRAAIEAKTMPRSLSSPPLSEPEVPSTASVEEMRAETGETPALPLLPSPSLEPAPGKRSFDLRGDSRELFEQVTRAYGLDVIFAEGYQPYPSIRFRLEQAEFGEALRSLEAATNSFLVPVSEKLGMVAKDNDQMRRDLEHHEAAVVPVPHPVSLQEAQELVRSVQQAMEIQRLMLESQRRLIVVRDYSSKVRPAKALLEQLLLHRTQVSIEVEFLELRNSATQTLGVQVPTRHPLAWLSRIWNAAPSIPRDVGRLATFGGGRTFFGIGAFEAELFASMTRSNSQSRLRAELVAQHGLPSSLHLGDKYPVMTAGYFGATTGTGELFRPPPTFTFEDLGVVVKVTPQVHSMEEITLDVEADYKVLTGQVANGIPVIASRSFKSSVRLRQGEWAVMAGLLTASESRTVTGLAGLASVPVLGALFRRTETSREEGEALLVLKPRLTSLPPSESVTTPLWTGSEARPRIPL